MASGTVGFSHAWQKEKPHGWEVKRHQEFIYIHDLRQNKFCVGCDMVAQWTVVGLSPSWGPFCVEFLFCERFLQVLQFPPNPKTNVKEDWRL